MHEWLIEAWNEVVGDDDDVWVVGDVAMGNIQRSLRSVERLRGTLRLVVGNHDKPFQRGGTARIEWEERYRQAGFADIYHGTVPYEIAGTPVDICHFPHVGDSRDSDRYAEHRPVDNGRWLLHGHTHGKWLQRGRCIDVGVDAWGGRLVDITTLASIITAEPTDREPVPWGTHIEERRHLLNS